MSAARRTPPRDGERAGPRWLAFWSGLTVPSLPGLLLTLAIAGGSWVALVFGLTHERMSAWSRYFAASRRDTCAFVTGRVQEVRADAALGRPLVVVIGASGTRDAISGADEVRKRLSERLPVEPVVHGLITDGQNLLETAALLEQLPERFDGLIVVDVNPYRLAAGIAGRQPDGSLEYRLGFRNRVFEEFIDQVGIENGEPISYFWDNREFFLPRMRNVYRNLRRGAPTEIPRPPQREGGRFVNEATWRGFTSVAVGLVESWTRRAGPGLELLAEQCRVVRARGDVAIALLEGPIAPRARDTVWGVEFLAEYRANMVRFAQENGLLYWDVAAEAELGRADFYDWGHLNSADARERFTRVLVDRIAGVLASR